uniref:Claudin n=1 Tax=Geotrypetes seraphini TaxID=260995 RepID=A0A6P8SBT0_GEOSA|nr:claudin-15-like [Geotrypetes seraphini]
MSAGLEITGFLLSLTGWLIIGASLSNSYWKVSSQKENVITTSNFYENLWKSCASESTGISNCKSFTSLLSLPAYIQACRALMIISIILGLLATVISLVGLKCIKVGSNDERKKGMIALVGGLSFILAGLCSMVAISWYAGIITAQFFDPLHGGTKYELGSALYLGWAGSILAILGGAFLCCSYKGKKKSKPSIYRNDYSTAQNASSGFMGTRNSKNTMASRAYV